jgi:hypothetical protein
MKRLTIAIAMSTRRFDGEGFVYCKEIHQLERDGEVPEVLRGELQRLPGGYVFVLDGMIWNALQPIRYAPEHIRIPVDSLVFAAGLLADLVAQLGHQSRLVCMFWEMASLRIEVEAQAGARITVVDHEDAEIFPPEVVDLRQLLRELLCATEGFLRIAAGELGRRAASRPGAAVPDGTSDADRQFLDGWRRSADHLRRRLENTGPGLPS